VAEKRRSAEAARAEIRETALDLFVAQGYGATSLEDIAGRLDRTRQAVLYHFKSKEELLRSVLDPYFTAVNEVLDELTTSDPPTHEDRLAALTALVDVYTSNRGAIALLNRFTTDSKIADLGPLLSDLNARVRQLLGGSAVDTDPALRVRVFAVVASLAGVMAVRADVPLSTPGEKRSLVLGCLAMLETGA
jgi:AcrR family transcriptional regulator